MQGAIKAGHIPGLTLLGCRREKKCLVVDPVDDELVKRIFTMKKVLKEKYGMTLL